MNVYINALYFVADVPVVSLKMGSTLNPGDIKEGDDVYFECNIRANPKAYKLSWFHNVSVELEKVTYSQATSIYLKFLSTSPTYFYMFLLVEWNLVFLYSFLPLPPDTIFTNVYICMYL